MPRYPSISLSEQAGSTDFNSVTVQTYANNTTSGGHASVNTIVGTIFECSAILRIFMCIRFLGCLLRVSMSIAN